LKKVPAYRRSSSSLIHRRHLPDQVRRADERQEHPIKTPGRPPGTRPPVGSPVATSIGAGQRAVLLPWHLRPNPAMTRDRCAFPLGYTTLCHEILRRHAAGAFGLLGIGEFPPASPQLKDREGSRPQTLTQGNRRPASPPPCPTTCRQNGGSSRNPRPEGSV
jgi:hypothetical protein